LPGTFHSTDVLSSPQNHQVLCQDQYGVDPKLILSPTVRLCPHLLCSSLLLGTCALDISVPDPSLHICLSRPARVPPGNLTGSDGRLRKDKRQTCKIWDQVAWVLWWRHTTASTTSSEFIIYSGKPGSGLDGAGGSRL
jgi:hypothetical protein